MWSDLAAVGIGIAFAFYLLLAQRRRLRKKVYQRFPDLMQRWRALDCRTRRKLTRDMRTGETVPVEHAGVVIGMIDVSVTIDGERLPTFWRRVRRAYALWLVVLVALVVMLSASSNPGLHFLTIVYASTVATILVRLTVGVLLTRRRLHTWPASRARTRAQAVRDLAAAAPDGS